MLYVRESMLDTQDAQVLIDTLTEVQSGVFNAIDVQTGPIHQLLLQSSRVQIPSFTDYHLPYALAFLEEDAVAMTSQSAKPEIS